MNQESRNCQNCKNQFIIEPEDFAFYEKMHVPAPTWCPGCRFKRRAVFRNEFSLYNRNCGLCSNAIVSMYSPHGPYTVYCNECWHSDKWDSFSFARSYEPGRPFFEQLRELVLQVPKCALYKSDVMQSVNSPYENFAGGNKDCYFIANSGPDNENCAYGRGLIKTRDAFDSYYVDQSEKIYEGIGIHNSTGIIWGQNVFDSMDSRYIMSCSGLQNCFGCVNLRHKSYHFLNEPLSKMEYRQRVDAIRGSYAETEKFRKTFETFSLQFPRRASSNLKSVNVSGDYIFESKDCRGSFELSFCENVCHSFSVKKSRDAYDILGHGRGAELILECVAVGYGSRVLGCWWAENAQDIAYCLATRNSQFCLGCDGIKNAKYMIFNRQYSEEEYKKLRERIVAELIAAGDYGLFFPPQIALFAYNETVAQSNVPLTREQAIKEGFRWEDNPQITKGKETMPPGNIPDHIRDVRDTILQEVLACAACGRNYRLTPAELNFYREAVVPVPRKCFYCRLQDRVTRRGPMKLFDRNCDRCKKPIQTNYAPDRPEIVYCENCYQAEVV